MSRFSAQGRPFRRRRAEVLAESDVCALCGYPGADTVDHVVPRSRGGQNERENLRPAHRRCNSSRGAGRDNARRRQIGDWYAG